VKVGILSQFPSQAIQSGPAIHTRFLHDGLERRGHDVVMMGPDTGDQAPVDGTHDFLFPSVSYATHPDVRVALPGSPLTLFGKRPDVDVIHGQANCHMMHYGVWAREMWGIPYLNTHIIHLPTHSHFILSDSLFKNDRVRDWTRERAYDMERNFAEHIYNRGDGFIVQSRHMVKYWRERGVTVPIEVVGRPVNPGVFSRPASCDPFPAGFAPGKRLLVVCRHDREKSLDRLIDIFAKEIAPRAKDVTLTLVGDGHDHTNLVQRALASGFGDRIHFPGEVSHKALVDWYAHADLFVYTSVSETFGNVVNEALWCGVPVVAFDDKMGVAGQVVDRVNGALIDPNVDDADARFGATTLALLKNQGLRAQLGGEAANLARRTAHPDVVLSRFEQIYKDAIRHRKDTLPVPLVKRNRLVQLAAFARQYSAWAFWNGAVVALGHTAAGLGQSRGGATQHAAGQVLVQAAATEQARADAAGERVLDETASRPAA
jgi:glycosyltransferase involved in cell wall biosynthesis